MEASSFARYTWPSVAARAFGYVDVLSWDRRYNVAMFAYTWRALHGVGPLPAGDKRRQFTKTVVIRQHRSALLEIATEFLNAVRVRPWFF